MGLYNSHLPQFWPGDGQAVSNYVVINLRSPAAMTLLAGRLIVATALFQKHMASERFETL
jgi:hypothetical protein